MMGILLFSRTFLPPAFRCKNLSLKGPSPTCSQPFYPIWDETDLDKALELRTYYGFVEFGMRNSTQVAGGICLHCATESEKISIEQRNGRHYGALFEVKSCRNTETLKPCSVAV